MALQFLNFALRKRYNDRHRSPALPSRRREYALLWKEEIVFAQGKLLLAERFIPLTGYAGAQLVRNLSRVGHTPGPIAAAAAPRACKYRAPCQTAAAAAPKIQAPSQARAPKALAGTDPKPRADARA